MESERKPSSAAMSDDITKEKLIDIIKGLLKTDTDLHFLQELHRGDLEKLVACIRDRIDRLEK